MKLPVLLLRTLVDRRPSYGSFVQTSADYFYLLDIGDNVHTKQGKFFLRNANIC